METTETTTVRVERVSDYWGATLDRTCDQLRCFFRNGETHLKLRDRVTGEVFESPAIFWTDES